MKAVTIREAKARLNALVEAAERGEQIVLMRGSKHVAAIVPVSVEDLDLSPSLTDAQAYRMWRKLHEERQAEKRPTRRVVDENRSGGLFPRNGCRRGTAVLALSLPEVQRC
jgi:prevent-host-death family protein